MKPALPQNTAAATVPRMTTGRRPYRSVNRPSHGDPIAEPRIDAENTAPAAPKPSFRSITTCRVSTMLPASTGIRANSDNASRARTPGNANTRRYGANCMAGPFTPEPLHPLARVRQFRHGFLVSPLTPAAWLPRPATTVVRREQLHHRRRLGLRPGHRDRRRQGARHLVSEDRARRGPPRAGRTHPGGAGGGRSDRAPVVRAGRVPAAAPALPPPRTAPHRESRRAVRHAGQRGVDQSRPLPRGGLRAD